MAWYSSIFSKRKTALRRGGEAVAPKVAKARVQPNPALPQLANVGFEAPRLDQNPKLHRMRIRLREAFTPSSPVQNASMLSGRLEVLRMLIRSIEDQHLHVVLYGERGIGKTSLLHVLSQIAINANYVVRYTSCSEEAEISELFRGIFQNIPLLYHRDFDPTAEQVEEGFTFADLLPEGQLSVPLITDTFAKLNGTRMLLILDEFDRAQTTAFRRGIAELIKNLSDRSVGVQLIIGGVAGNLTELIEQIPSIRRNILGLPLPNMREEEVLEMVGKAETMTGLEFAEDVRRDICVVSCGLPYLASLIGQHAGIAALDRESAVVETQDLRAATEAVESETRYRISQRALYALDQLRAEGREPLLGELARAALGSAGRILPEQFEEICGGEAAAARFLSELERRAQLIKPIAGDPAGAYSFLEDGIPVYLWLSSHNHPPKAASFENLRTRLATSTPDLS